LLGRAGELVRPYYIARKHGSELSPQLSVWLLERVFDMFGIVLLLSLDLGLSPRIHLLTRDAGYAEAFRRAGILMSAGIAFLIVLLYVFHVRAPKLLARLRPRAEARRQRLRRRVVHFLQALADGLSALTNSAKLLKTIFYTVVLWVVVALSIWAVVRAYPAMLPGFSFTEGVLLMTLTAIGAVATLPAVGGGFQVLTIFGLVQVFGADSAAATSAALVVWLVCFYAVAPFGAALATHEGVSWRGIERAAYATEAAEER
ncbi:MAG: flippase-like domain-containing protein, partial [Terriglobales bacterium]